MEIDTSKMPIEDVSEDERKAYDEHREKLGTAVGDNPWKFPWKLTTIELPVTKKDGNTKKLWFPSICDSNGDLICNGADGSRIKFLMECANFVHENSNRKN